jgi:hypothetical protein
MQLDGPHPKFAGALADYDSRTQQSIEPSNEDLGIPYAITNPHLVDFAAALEALEADRTETAHNRRLTPYTYDDPLEVAPERSTYLFFVAGKPSFVLDSWGCADATIWHLQGQGLNVLVKPVLDNPDEDRMTDAGIGQTQGELLDLRRCRPISIGYSQSDLDKVALRLNQRPRKTLGFETPASKLRASVASIH